MKYRSSLLVVLFLGLVPCLHANEAVVVAPNSSKETTIPTVPVDPKDLQNALTVMNRFLDSVTAGDFESCYDLAGAVVKARISRDKWIKQLAAGVTAMGPRAHGEFVAAIETTSMLNGPPGKYISVALLTEFPGSKFMETIVLVDEDGNWHVVGYLHQRAESGAS